MRLAAVITGIILALIVAACGSSRGTTSGGATGPSGSAAPISTTTGMAAPAPTSATSAAGATGTGASTTHRSSTHTSASTATPAPAAVRPPVCVAGDLSPSFLGGQGATGHGLLGFALRNHTGRSCRTHGYPGVLFLDRQARPLPTASTRTTHDFFGPVRAVRLLVRPGRSVSFRLGVTHVAVGGARCTTAYALQVIAPDDTARMRVAIPAGAYECGTTTVSPPQPGLSAYPG